ncbi:MULTISPECIES: tail fiber domain-containing protein [unclassified Cryobacterium]|uniref:tail fiber domain-containing protein n=1 Tax=unclassified Cryobacterium TaxID=2649013 RepID=UPI001069E610|nr:MULTISPECIES: tail fiber domain-containing protein [unclassified Cryobacterium]TFC00253.1 tail fiber domain-containing protein [Cryobacterium sp. MDB2-A-1]TFC14117.1 tail fiber domain-containing protein [Cryobacterium sp. MDB2-A-2]
MFGPGNIGNASPAGEDWIPRKFRDIERYILELNASIALSIGPVVKRANDTLDTVNATVVTVNNTIATVTALSAHVDDTLVNIDSTVQASIRANSMTTAAIQSLVANPPAGSHVTGNVSATGTVTATGAVSGATGTFGSGVASTGVYTTLLTYGGGYKAQYVHVDGTMGYVPSSRQFKQDITPTTLDPALLTALQLVTFRYIDAVDNLGDQAETELGLIAEDVDALGLHWLVDYDSDHKPTGLKYERLALLVIPWAQSIEARLAALEG